MLAPCLACHVEMLTFMSLWTTSQNGLKWVQYRKQQHKLQLTSSSVMFLLDTVLPHTSSQTEGHHLWAMYSKVFCQLLGLNTGLLLHDTCRPTLLHMSVALSKQPSVHTFETKNLSWDNYIPPNLLCSVTDVIRTELESLLASVGSLANKMKEMLLFNSKNSRLLHIRCPVLHCHIVDVVEPSLGDSETFYYKMQTVLFTEGVLLVGSGRCLRPTSGVPAAGWPDNRRGEKTFRLPAHHFEGF